MANVDELLKILGELYDQGAVGSNYIKDIKNETDKYEKLVEDSNKYLDKHISSIDAKLRARFDEEYTKYVTKRFEDLSGIGVSRRWSEIKARFARYASSGKTISKKLRRSKDPGKRWYDDRYRVRVSADGITTRAIKADNADSFAAATDYLKDQILRVLKSHDNSDEFKAVIDYAIYNGKKTPVYTFTLHDQQFFRNYPVMLSNMMKRKTGKGLMENIIPHPGSEGYAVFQAAILDAFNRLTSSSAELSGVKGLIRNGGQ